MNIAELILIALSLSADAFAVSVTNGMCAKNIKFAWTLAIALTFGLFQGAMPAIGYALGQTFIKYFEKFTYIIAFILLSFIGGKMIYDVIKNKEVDDCTENEMKISFGVLLVQGVATSIDALTVGISFSVLKVNIVTSAAFIAGLTFICCFIGVFIGRKFGFILNNKAGIIGGIILIIIGLKIFIEHAFFRR